MMSIRGKGAIEKGSANWQFAPLPLSDIDRNSSKARKGLGLIEGSRIERRKLPVCATVAETIFPFHYLDQFAIAFTGKWRDLRYGTGSGSDLAPPGAATTEAPGRYRSLYRTAAIPYTHLQTAIVLRFGKTTNVAA